MRAAVYWGVHCHTRDTHGSQRFVQKQSEAYHFFFFFSLLDIVYLTNDQDTLGAEVKHTVKIRVVEIW